MRDDLLDELLARQLERIRSQLDRLERLAAHEAARGDGLHRVAALMGVLGGIVGSILVLSADWLFQWWGA